MGWVVCDDKVKFVGPLGVASFFFFVDLDNLSGNPSGLEGIFRTTFCADMTCLLFCKREMRYDSLIARDFCGWAVGELDIRRVRTVET